MKRINLKTGEPFKFGDLREDGYTFWGYLPSKTNGYFREEWRSPESVEQQKQYNELLEVKARKLKHHNEYRLTPKGRAKELIRSARRRCKDKNAGHVLLSADWVIGKIENGVCELTGLPFDLSKKEDVHQNPYAPSLDRKDNKNPDYSEANVRVVLAAVNASISEHGLDVMRPIFKKLAAL